MIACFRQEADVVILRPGSLFRSTKSALLGGIKEALGVLGGPVVYVASLRIQLGETGSFTVSDQLRVIADHVGKLVLDVLVYSGEVTGTLVKRYEAEGVALVAVDREESGALGVRLREAGLISREASSEVRHDASRLVEEVREVAFVCC
jgi:uncharacterized cofD-like protein